MSLSEAKDVGSNANLFILCWQSSCCYCYTQRMGTLNLIGIWIYKVLRDKQEDHDIGPPGTKGEFNCFGRLILGPACGHGLSPVPHSQVNPLLSVSRPPFLSDKRIHHKWKRYVSLKLYVFG
eukprot:Protomagalhaensia_sp_Gyna_25__2072@NODE_2111_length_1286_cov_78_336808_g1744_i0_p2_GENE_NODE_2111_length_1286_cov_78_336808_g1744_i0NODE_2111_length_1286_cov_78_336808_g1744_i0_p2_ORF_typecomplete_len122_score10_56_NODE_2111_length_1286_cov_78_336808_g1744_i075440